MNVLVISAHPDDETLGCGGTLLRHAEQGDSIFWIVATKAIGPHVTPELLSIKALEVENVAKAYGVKKVFKLNLDTTKLDAIPQLELIESIRPVVIEVKPKLVYLVHSGDVHSDHHALFNAVLSVLKPFYMKKFGVSKILSYETLSSTEAAPPFLNRAFLPQICSDITPFIDQKIEIMQMYATEIHKDPMPRGPSAIRALARFRGASIGVEYAECFMLVKEVL
jgi:N-acetylglucosamine malate deacetylase 1